jgi:undecaprenyl-diphosphatase
MIFSHLQSILHAGGYWILGVISVVEALPLIGSIIPGHAAVFLAGFFAHLGILNVYIVALIASLGAFVGDIISFFLGRKYGYGLITRWGKYFLLKQEHIDKAKEALERHTGKAIILGRFTPVTRAYMPFLVGASQGNVKTFWVADFIGCVLWGTSSVAIGYVFGASYKVVIHYIGQFTTMGIGIAALVAIAYYFINSRRHIFAKYDLHILVALLVSLYFFFKMIQDVVSQPFMAPLDIAVSKVFSEHASHLFTMIMVGITNIFSPAVLCVAAVGLFAWFVWKKYRHDMYILVATFPTGLLFGYALKVVVGRVRPVNEAILETGYSFPSGHAVAAAIFFTLLIYFFSRYMKNRTTKEIFVMINVFLIALVGFSRVYLNVHWFSDVVAGISFGVFWTCLGILTVRYLEALTTGRGSKQIK